MKYNTKLIMALALGSLFAVSVASAQVKSAKRARPNGASAGNRPGPVREIARERITRMAEDLNLTAEQKSKLREYRRNQSEKRQAVREATPGERRQLARELRDARDRKLKEVLTGEQYSKWQMRRPAVSNHPTAPGSKRSKQPAKRAEL